MLVSASIASRASNSELEAWISIQPLPLAAVAVLGFETGDPELVTVRVVRVQI